MDFFNLFKKKEKSKNVAKERLKLVLVHDRSEMSPDFLDRVKGDLILAIEKHAEIDKEELDLKLTRMKDENSNMPVSALIANIPIIKIKED